MPDCVQPPATGGWFHHLIVVVAALIAVSLFLGLTWSIRRGDPQRAGGFSLLSSPIPMLLAATWWEGRNLFALLDPEKQSWALFGDALLVPPALAMCAVVWRLAFPPESKWRSWGWQLISAGVGIAAAIWFRIGELVAYGSLRANSPSKLAHDFIAYPVLAALLCYVLFSLFAALWRLRGRQKWWAVGALALIAVFFGLLFSGAGGGDPTFFHPEPDWNDWGRTLKCRP